MAQQRPPAFVIMPFAEEFRPAFEDIIRPAVEQAGMECIRGDQEAQGQIHRMIFDRIFDCPAIIADLSGGNPNVFYELGVAHSIARKTVTLTREDFQTRIPFDVAPYRVLLYPKPPDDPDDAHAQEEYTARAAEVVGALTAELRRIVQQEPEGIPNPVQDFLDSRSPLASAVSLYLDDFGRQWEEQMLQEAEELTYLGLSGSSFIGLAVSAVESGRRSGPLRLRMLLLDPADRESWRFVFGLREGRRPEDEQLEQWLAEERAMQARNERAVRRLAEAQGLSVEVVRYSGVPLFWAYLIDGRRLIVGHLAPGRIGARNLPVMVLVRDDPRTRSVYGYYERTIEATIAQSSPGLE